MSVYIKPTKTVALGVQAVADSTPYVLVDLSDTTNYPHTATGQVHLQGLLLNTEKASDGVYDIWAGVLTENDSDDGSVEWFEVFHIEAVGNATDSTDRMYVARDYTFGGSKPQGINLFVDDSSSTPYLTTNMTTADDSTYDNEVGLTGPGDDSTLPAAGDVILYVEEVSGTGTIDFSILAFYDTV